MNSISIGRRVQYLLDPIISQMITYLVLEYIGPEIIGRGSFGCIYYPVPKCQNVTKYSNVNYVMKITKSNSKEIEAWKRLRKRVRRASSEFRSQWILPEKEICHSAQIDSGILPEKEICHNVQIDSGIVPCPDDNLTYGFYYRYLPYDSVYKYFRKQRKMFPTIDSFWTFFGNLFRSIMELHKCGIYHGDLHEGNILVDSEHWMPYLIDFTPNWEAYMRGVEEDWQSFQILFSFLADEPLIHQSISSQQKINTIFAIFTRDDIPIEEKITLISPNF